MSAIDPDSNVRIRTSRTNEQDAESSRLANNAESSENLSTVSYTDVADTADQPHTSQAKNYDLTKVLKKIYNQMDQLKYRMQKDTYRRCINNEWMLVGTLVDKILFFVFCGIVLFSTRSIFKH